jgi:hypothetical protein
MFSFCCMVFWPLYCVFKTCKVKSVIKINFNYFERYSFIFHFTKLLSHFLKKLILNRNYFNSKSGERVFPSLCLYSKQKSRKNNTVIKQ